MKDNELLGRMMEYECGDLSFEDAVEFFQYLVDTGLAWTLPGHYGRTAQGLINAGAIITKGEQN